MNNKMKKSILRWIGMLLVTLYSANSLAEIVDEITSTPASAGGSNAVIRFNVPVQYLRHFPHGKSTNSSIFFNIQTAASSWQDIETRKTQVSDLIQEITVTTRDKTTGPKILVRFSRPVEFSVSMGKNNQEIEVRAKPVAVPSDSSSVSSVTPVNPAAAISALTTIGTAAASKSTVAVVPPVSPSQPVTDKNAQRPATPEPVQAKPSETQTAPAGPVAAPSVAPAAPAQPAPVVAPVPVVVAVPTAPSGQVVAPKITLASVKVKQIHIPLGGKDGLPAYPNIDIADGPIDNTPTDKLSLAEQIQKVNLQAAALMEKAGNALLAGQSMTALDAYNNVLNLPPNKYTEDAQLWVGITRERAGQQNKAVLEFNSYLKIYPDGRNAGWVKGRLEKLRVAQPELFRDIPKAGGSTKRQNTEMQFSQFGSISTYAYYGQSRIDTSALAGTVQSPTTISTVDQETLMTNIVLTARAYNNQYDNRLVFQDFYSKSFLSGQGSRNRLGSAFYELKDRIENYSIKVGVQSGYGGGVMGRFTGVAAGYGIEDTMRVNVVGGQLVDFSDDAAKPVFYGASVDFGLRNALGGSVYAITQHVSGVTDRQAIGGNLRYFEQGFTVMSILDYDTQFRELGILTVQGTFNSNGSGNDYNFMFDRRKSPILDVRNAVNGTAVTIQTLLQSGFTTSDLIDLAKLRTAATTLGQLGMTNHLNEQWTAGTDFTVGKVDGTPESGTLLADGTTGTEGYVAAMPDSGVTWTIGERLTGVGIFQPRDYTNFYLAYTHGPAITSYSFQLSNHFDYNDRWTYDSGLHIGMQKDNAGGSTKDIAPTLRATYKLRNDVSLDGQLGLDISSSSSSSLDNTTRTLRYFTSFGCRFDF